VGFFKAEGRRFDAQASPRRPKADAFKTMRAASCGEILVQPGIFMGKYSIASASDGGQKYRYVRRHAEKFCAFSEQETGSMVLFLRSLPRVG
jgi:hypothetical protein